MQLKIKIKKKKIQTKNTQATHLTSQIRATPYPEQGYLRQHVFFIYCLTYYVKEERFPSFSYSYLRSWWLLKNEFLHDYDYNLIVIMIMMMITNVIMIIMFTLTVTIYDYRL